MEIDELYMRRALQLAANGRGFTSPNPMVGAVIVCDGKIIGEGWHRAYGGPHAEVNAVNSVADRSLLQRSTIYVTLEPCSHFGKTPPCANLLVDCKIPRVVIGSLDPNEKVAGRGVEILRRCGAEVVVGVLEEECRKLNVKFMTAHTLRRPYILLKWACSTDGFMDCQRSAGQPAPKFSSPLTMQLMHKLRGEFDAIMVGSGTVLNDNPRLDVRHIPGRSPKKIILDRRGRIPTTSAVFQSGTTFYVGPKLENFHFISTGNVNILNPDLTISEIMSELFKAGITSVMVEGGATLLNSLIGNKLWDAARIEIAPLELGTSGRTPMQIPAGEMQFRQIDGRTIINICRNTQ